MKTNRIICTILACAALCSAQSCLKNQHDYFETPASGRMQQFVSEVKDILISQTEGWALEYYPGVGQSRGGYQFYLKFYKDTEKFGTPEEPVSAVWAMSEIKPALLDTCLFKLTTDNGPVLSFDGYSEVIHFFATPSSSEYEAKGGDFEFTILSYSADKIELLGKRSGNICTLIPFTKIKDVDYAHISDKALITPEKFIGDVKAMSSSVRAATVEGVIGGRDVKGTVDLNNRCISFIQPLAKPDTTYVDGVMKIDTVKIIRMPFLYTPSGLRAYDDVTINDNTFRELSYFSEENVFTNFVFTLKGQVPDNYATLAELTGDFQLVYNNGKNTLDITVEDVDGKTVLMKGFNPGFDLRATYNGALGRLELMGQVVGANGSNTVAFVPWALDPVAGSGSVLKLDYVGEAGMAISLDKKDTSRKTFLFTDAETLEGFETTSFILLEYTSAGEMMDEYAGFGEPTRWQFLSKMIRK